MLTPLYITFQAFKHLFDNAHVLKCFFLFVVKLVHVNNVSFASVVTLTGKIIFGCLDMSSQIFMFPRQLLAILKHITDHFLFLFFSLIFAHPFITSGQNCGNA